MTATHHKAEAEKNTPSVQCGVITVSDTRTVDSDKSGVYIKERLREAGHTIQAYHIVPDDPSTITQLISELEQSACQLVILNGGTGISHRDATFEAVDNLLDKRLPGFGELFRMLSYDQIGSAAMLSRATAGLYKQVFLFSIPGSPKAVQLAMDKLIIPEIPHLIWEINRLRS